MEEALGKALTKELCKRGISLSHLAEIRSRKILQQQQQQQQQQQRGRIVIPYSFFAKADEMNLTPLVLYDFSMDRVLITGMCESGKVIAMASCRTEHDLGKAMRAFLLQERPSVKQMEGVQRQVHGILSALEPDPIRCLTMLTTRHILAWTCSLCRSSSSVSLDLERTIHQLGRVATSCALVIHLLTVLPFSTTLSIDSLVREHLSEEAKAKMALRMGLVRETENLSGGVHNCDLAVLFDGFVGLVERSRDSHIA